MEIKITDENDLTKDSVEKEYYNFTFHIMDEAIVTEEIPLTNEEVIPCMIIETYDWNTSLISQVIIVDRVVR